MLRVRALSKSFGAIRALRSIDIDIEQGTIHGIIGPNGSGKTTLFNCISGLCRADSGQILLQGEQIQARSGDAIARAGIRRTFQAGKLIPGLTVVENIMAGVQDGFGAAACDLFGRRPFARRAREQAIRARALALCDDMGLGHARDRRASDLVWAELQRVQIARALIAEPRVLLLDEPASGMGPQETQQISARIRALRTSQSTVVVISHDIGMVMDIADRLSVFNFGQIIAEGSPAEVRAQKSVVEAYLGVD